VLGYDRYEQDEVEQIEAEAAEIALKRAFSEERRMDLAKEGMALPDGSYPIVSETDLRNAIQAFGRAKDKEATKKHIMKRARALNMESLIPANWLAGSKEKGEALNDAEFMASLVEFQLLEDSADNN
jgi:heme oxygenase